MAGREREDQDMFERLTMARRGEAREQTLDLARDATLRIPPGAGGTMVRVERGLFLVTREGDPEDHVLEPGMELCLPSSGRSVGWALAASRVRVLGVRRAVRERRSGRPASAAAGC
jgi:Protein of unknown function (DUF2917)